MLCIFRYDFGSLIVFSLIFFCVIFIGCVNIDNKLWFVLVKVRIVLFSLFMLMLYVVLIRCLCVLL